MTLSIAFIIPSLQPGGAERVVATLAQGLAADFRIHVFIAPGAERHYAPEGVEIHEVELDEPGLQAAIATHGIDLVLDHYHWSAPHVRLMARLAGQGLPVVLTEHNAYHYPLFQGSRGRVPGQEAWFHERYAHYRRFAAVTVLNEDSRRRFARHLDNVRHIPNPLPYEVAEPALGGGETVLNVSSFRKPAKRLDLLYRSFARLQGQRPGARLEILGEYDWLADRWLRAVSGIAPAGLSCPGRSRRVAQHYARATVFALTSEIEGQPMALLEAAHHGLPQVAFDLPGLSDQIREGETGHLVPFGDTAAFADRLAGLLADPARARRMGRAARDFVRQAFDPAAILERWRGLIAEIAARGRLPAPEAGAETGTETGAETGAEAVSAPGPTEEIWPEDAAAEAFWQGHWRAVARRGTGDPSVAPDPKLSFLVPVHGTEDLLGRCLASIRDQSLAEFECIVVDDGSPGDAEAAFRAAAGGDGRFRLIRHGRNRGLYQARSTAAAAARGLYFAHVDSDDYIHPRFGEILFAKAMMTGAEIAECQAVELLPDGSAIRFSPPASAGPFDGAEARRAFFNDSLRNVVWNKIYARDLWRRTPVHQGIDTGLTVCEDLLRNSLLFPECRRYAAVEDCLYFYCRRPASAVRGGGLQRLMQKIGDISFSYAMAMAAQGGPGKGGLGNGGPGKGGPGNGGAGAEADRALALRQLGLRRQRDLSWYLGEYLQRTDARALQAEMAAMAGQDLAGQDLAGPDLAGPDLAGMEER